MSRIPPLHEALGLARGGDERGYTAIYAALGGRVASYLRTRSAWDVDDLTNHVFADAFRSLGTFEGDADALRGWIFSIARNKAIDDARARARRPLAPDIVLGVEPTGNAEDDVFARLGHDWVMDQLDGLTDDQRDVLALRLVDDLTIPQIAVIVDKPVDAVKALQKRGLRALQKRIAADPSPFSDDGR